MLSQPQITADGPGAKFVHVFNGAEPLPLNSRNQCPVYSRKDAYCEPDTVTTFTSVGGEMGLKEFRASVADKAVL